MALGRSVRLAELARSGGRGLVFVPMDHALAHGVLPGIVDAARALDAVAAGGPDAVTLHRGVAERFFAPHAGRVALVLKCSTYSPYDRGFDAVVAEVEDAVRLGAAAVAVGLIVGDRRQPEALSAAARLVSRAEQLGMPVVGHVYPRGDAIDEDARRSVAAVSYAARVAMELGMDIVKTDYTGSPESFAEVVAAAAPIKVLAAGGLPSGGIEPLLRTAQEVVASGAAGVAFGRAVWDDPDPGGAVRAVKAVVHEGRDLATALARYGRGAAA